MKDRKRRGRRMQDNVLREEKQLDNDWALDLISDSDDDDFVTKKPKGARHRGPPPGCSYEITAVLLRIAIDGSFLVLTDAAFQS